MSNLFERIVEAHQAIRPQVAVTPLEHSPALSRLAGCEVYLKCEHLQRTGSFKVRGAVNKLRRLGAAAQRTGVVTASTGNHGQGVALAGKLAGVPVTVYASAAASPLKLEAIAALGAEVVTLEADTLGVELEAARQARRQGKPFVSPYNDADVIAGQGTIGLELLEQCPELDAVFTSVGGGGLVSGVGTAVKHLRPQARVVGCWPRNAPALYRALEAGEIVAVEESETISDGTAGGVEPGSITFDIVRRVLDDAVLVDEAEIKQAMRLLAQTERWLVEGAAGVALAGLLARAPAYRGQSVAVVLCGRNILLDTFLEAVGLPPDHRATA
jgi:threonine dehydratase